MHILEQIAEQLACYVCEIVGSGACVCIQFAVAEINTQNSFKNGPAVATIRAHVFYILQSEPT